MKDATFAYLVKLFRSKKFNKRLRDIENRYLDKVSANQLPFKKQSELRKELRTLLEELEAPLHLVEVLFSFLSDRDPDFPNSPTISLEVANQKVGEEGTILLLKDENGRLIDDPEIAIKIHANISTDEIIRYIQDHKDLLDEAMTVLDLPQIPNVSKWKQVRLALEIIRLKDEEGMTFSSISTTLINQDNLSDEEIEYLSNESNIKNNYYRYIAYFSK